MKDFTINMHLLEELQQAEEEFLRAIAYIACKNNLYLKNGKFASAKQV